MKRYAIVAGLLLATAVAAQRGASTAGSISGTLLWRDGTPAAGVRVSAVESLAGNRGADVALMAITQTDSAGRFRLYTVPSGRYFISAGLLDAPTFFPGVLAETDATRVEVAAGATVTGIDFRLVTARFSGRIVRQDLTNPAAPPLIPVKADPASPAIVQIRLTGSNRQPLLATVARDGSFEFTTLRPDTYQIALNPSVRGPALAVTIGDRDMLDYRIILPYVVTVMGVVTMDAEAPIPRFQLIFSDINQPPPPAAGPIPAGQANLVNAQVAAVMTAQIPTGIHRVTANGLPSGYVVKSIAAGAMDLTSGPLTLSAAGVPPIQIVLGITGTPHWPAIRGRISGRGSLDTVTLTTTGPLASPATPRFFLDGSFEIPRLAPGQYMIRVQSPGTASLASVRVAVMADDVNNVVVDVPAADAVGTSGATYGPRVRGRIVGHARAAPGASVRLTGSGVEPQTAPIYMDGSFEFPHVPSGVYQAAVIPRIPGADPATFRVGATDLSGIEIPVPATQEIAGRAVVDHGGAIPRALRFMAADVEIPTPLQPDGRFILIAPEGQKLTVAPASLPSGFAVRSLTDGERDLLKDPLLFATAANGALKLTLSSPATAAVRGHVIGNPATLNGGHVWLADKAGLLRTLESPVARNGGFEFPTVAPGAYTLRVAAPGVAADGETAITVTAGKDLAGIELFAPGEP